MKSLKRKQLVTALQVSERRGGRFVPTASANKLPETKSSSAGEECLLFCFRIKRQPAAAEWAAVHGTAWRRWRVRDGNICLCRTCWKSNKMQERGREVSCYWFNLITLLLIFHCIGKCQMVLLFISFLSDLDNNEKSLKDGRSKNYRPRSYRGSCLLGSGLCQVSKRKVGWEKLS